MKRLVLECADGLRIILGAADTAPDAVQVACEDGEVKLATLVKVTPFYALYRQPLVPPGGGDELDPQQE